MLSKLALLFLKSREPLFITKIVNKAVKTENEFRKRNTKESIKKKNFRINWVETKAE